VNESSHDRPGIRLALALGVQLAASLALLRHLGDQLNPDAAVYGRMAQLWLAGDAALALNATWGVLGPWLAVPGIALGLDPPTALRVGQVAAAVLATVGTDALLGCFAIRPAARMLLLLAGALYAATASTIVLTSDASYVAAFAWMCWALVTPRETIGRVPRAAVAGLLAAASFLARPVGLPMGVAMVVGSEWLRTGEEGWRRCVRSLALAACGWALVAVPWIVTLSVHYGRPTMSHSPLVVHQAVGPHTDHPWNMPSFTRLHRPPEGRITTWEDPSIMLDPRLEWSPFESEASWRHQVGLLRANGALIVRELVGFDGLGIALGSLVLTPLLSIVRRRRGIGWRETWLGLCLVLHVVALAPLHVERRYLWPLFPVALAGLGTLAARVAGDAAGEEEGRRAHPLAGVALIGLLLPTLVVSGFRVVALLAFPARHERAVVARWTALVRQAGGEGPVVSWSVNTLKTLDAEGLYLAWMLGRPWLGNLATDGHDLDDAVSLGARLVVAKTALDDGTPPAPLRDWRVLAREKVEGTTLRDGWYFVAMRP
jgi:hypothetical protein